MIVKANEFGFGGLNTRASSTGLDLLEGTVVQDCRVVGRDLVQRLGMVRVAQLSHDFSAMDFNGTTQYVSNTVDTRVWGLGLYWTVEIAFELDTTAGTQGIFVAGSTTPAMVLDVTGTNIRLRVWDSSATTTTITVGAASTSKQTVQITRSAATLSTKLDNGTATTGSMSATLSCRTPAGDLRIGRDDSTNYFNGTIDYLRAFSVVKSDHNDRLIRLPNPRGRYVLADYDFNGTAASLVYDRSRYENHLIMQATPAEIATLCNNPAPVRCLSMAADENQKKQLLAASGGKYYCIEVD